MNATDTILLVEDDRVDAMAVQRAWRELQIANPLSHVHNGEEALAYLQDPLQLRPGLILMDLNMPRMNGLELLREVKADPRLRRIPAVVLTTSAQEQDRAMAYELGAAGYILKPVDFPEFIEVMRAVHRYWSRSELSS